MSSFSTNCSFFASVSEADKRFKKNCSEERFIAEQKRNWKADEIKKELYLTAINKHPYRSLDVLLWFQGYFNMHENTFGSF